MSKSNPPLVPTTLCEILQPYPELITRLQETLDQFAESKPRLQPFDEAVWALKNRLGVFLAESADELDAATTSGDFRVIKQAKDKKATIGRALLCFDRDLDDLWSYFEENKRAYE
ncbi:hypothetical protein J8I29_08830 [Labrys sp. LIt4]|uniref:hypothetical protein n=1 Tax=Labrys sp. LIt4 TaxID=2821355 RepID=UPI001ADF5F0D|nr:hypothetical protein [Labrys sp. LIt4]MBP0579408.1 hypothetical protein [Labrys sp. LIt4]